MKKLFDQVNSSKTLQGFQSKWTDYAKGGKEQSNPAGSGTNNEASKGARPSRDSEDGSGNSKELAQLRQQLVDAKVKNGLLLSELEEARTHASLAGQLRGQVEDYKVKLVFALKRGTGTEEQLIPKVVAELQKELSRLSAELGNKDAQLLDLKTSNMKLKMEVQSLQTALKQHKEALVKDDGDGEGPTGGRAAQLDKMVKELEEQLRESKLQLQHQACSQQQQHQQQKQPLLKKSSGWDDAWDEDVEDKEEAAVLQVASPSPKPKPLKPARGLHKAGQQQEQQLRPQQAHQQPPKEQDRVEHQLPKEQSQPSRSQAAHSEQQLEQQRQQLQEQVASLKELLTQQEERFGAQHARLRSQVAELQAALHAARSESQPSNQPAQQHESSSCGQQHQHPSHGQVSPAPKQGPTKKLGVTKLSPAAKQAAGAAQQPGAGDPTTNCSFSPVPSNKASGSNGKRGGGDVGVALGVSGMTQEELQEQVVQLVAQMQELQDELAGELKRRRQAEQQLERQQQKAAQSAGSCASCERLQQQAEASEAQAEASKRQFTQQLEEAAAALAVQEQAMHELQALMGTLQSEADAARADSSASAQKLDQARTVVKSAKAQAAAAGRRAEQAEQERDELAAEAKVTNRKMKSATERIVAITESEYQADQVLRRFAELEAEMSQNRALAASADERIAAAEARAEQAEQLAEHAQQQLEEAQQEADGVKQQLLEARQQLELVQQQQQQQQEHKAEQSGSEQQQEQIGNGQHESQMQRQIGELQQQLAAAQEQVADLQQHVGIEHESQMQQQIGELQQQLAAAQLQVKEAHQQLTDMQRQLSEAQQQLDRAHKQLGGMQQQLDEAQQLKGEALAHTQLCVEAAEVAVQQVNTTGGEPLQGAGSKEENDGQELRVAEMQWQLEEARQQMADAHAQAACQNEQLQRQLDEARQQAAASEAKVQHLQEGKDSAEQAQQQMHEDYEGQRAVVQQALNDGDARVGFPALPWPVPQLELPQQQPYREAAEAHVQEAEARAREAEEELSRFKAVAATAQQAAMEVQARLEEQLETLQASLQGAQGAGTREHTQGASSGSAEGQLRAELSTLEATVQVLTQRLASQANSLKQQQQQLADQPLSRHQQQLERQEGGQQLSGQQQQQHGQQGLDPPSHQHHDAGSPEQLQNVIHDASSQQRGNAPSSSTLRDDPSSVAYQSEVLTLERTVLQLIALLQHHQKQCTALPQQATSQASLTRLSHQLEQEREDAQKQAGQLVHTQQESATLCAQYKTSMSSMGASFQQKMDTLQAEHAALQAEHASNLEAMRAALAEAENIAQEARAAAAEAQRRFDAAGYEVEALREQCFGIEASANERVERLQKINKKRSAENDDLRAQLSGVTSRLTSVETDAEKRVAALEAQAAELGERNRALAKEAAELGGQLAMVENECHRLLQQASHARVLGEEKAAAQILAERLKAKVAELEQQLSEATGLRTRVLNAEAARDAAAEETIKATNMLNNLEARLSEVEEDNERLMAALDEARLRSAFASNQEGSASGLTARATLSGEQPRPGSPSPAGSMTVPHQEQLPHGLGARFQADFDRTVTGKGLERGNSTGSSSFELNRVQEAGGREVSSSNAAAAAAEERAEALQAALQRMEAELESTRAGATQLEQALRDEMVAMAAAHGEELKEAVAGALSNAEEAEAALQLATHENTGLKKQIAMLQEELQQVRGRSRALLEERERQLEELRRTQRAPTKPGAPHMLPSLHIPTYQASTTSSTMHPIHAGHTMADTCTEAGGSMHAQDGTGCCPNSCGNTAGRSGRPGGPDSHCHPPSRTTSINEIEPVGDAASDTASMTSSRGGPAGPGHSHHSRTASEVDNKMPQWQSGLQAIIDSVGMLASRYGSSQQDMAKLQQLQQQVQAFRAAYEDSERTHALRSQSEATLKAELHQIRALGAITDADVSYLRRVLVDAFTCGALPRTSPMFPVIARILKLSTAELHNIKVSAAKVQRDPSAAQHQVEGSVLSQLASIWNKS